MGEMDDETRRALLRQWRESRREFERLWSKENKRAQDLFEERFVAGAVRRWKVSADEIREVLRR